MRTIDTDRKTTKRRRKDQTGPEPYEWPWDQELPIRCEHGHLEECKEKQCYVWCEVSVACAGDLHPELFPLKDAHDCVGPLGPTSCKCPCHNPPADSSNISTGEQEDCSCTSLIFGHQTGCPLDRPVRTIFD